MQARKYTHVIWDWNGTLFDDVAWCVKTVNQLLAKRGIKAFENAAEYRDVFCFPVIAYYRNVGFDFEKEPFEAIAKEFIRFYHSDKTGNCQLCSNADVVLEAIRKRRIEQVLLSASEIGNLLSQINEFDIPHYFDEILGLSDIYAKSKVEIGIDYMNRKRVESAVLIGDTVHDHEVAKALGADCLLIASGHQSKAKLLAYDVPVLDDILQAVDFIY